MHLLSVFSLRNRALIALVTIVIGVFGAVSLSTLKQELIPSLSLPNIFIITAYPGASPEVVNNDVSTPIETAIQGVAGLEGTTATSNTNFSSITASFSYGTNIASAEQKVQLAINRIKSQLPADVEPQVLTFSFSDLPVVQIAVTSSLDDADLAAAINGSVLADIRKLEGVADASLLGAVTQRVTITPDNAKLFAVGVTTQDIRSALDDNGLLLPAGSITEDGKTLTVQAGDRVTSVEEIASLPLVGASSYTTIGDVAEVEIVRDPVTGISRVDGEPSVTIAVTKSPDGNVVAVSKLVNELIPELEESIGGDTRMTVVFDQAPFIEESIRSLALEGGLGLLFAVIVIFLFLFSFRSTVVAAISIPVSVLITFIGMWASNYSLNIITLGALTISIGRVVDDSIVVIENIKRHLSLGESKGDAIRTAVREVAGAITASTITTVAVFLPLALVGDITGELFRPFALTVAIALAASLFVSLTIVPVLAYWFLGRRSGSPTVAPKGDELDRPTRLQRGYLPVITWTLQRPIVTILLAGLVLGGTAAAAPLLKTNFIGDSGQNTLTVRQSLPLGTSLDEQDKAAKKLEEVLVNLDGIETVQLSLGNSGSSLRAAFAGNGGATFSLTTDPDADQVELQAAVRDAVEDLEDAGEVTLSTAGSGFASSTIAVNITANSDADLREAAQTILDEVRDLDVVAEATSNLSVVQPYLAVTVDREAAAKAGLSEIAVGGIVTAAMNPSSSGSVVIDEKTLSIYINNTDAPTTVEELEDFLIPTNRGFVPLTDLATVEEVDGPSSVTTIKGIRSATVSITPGTDDVGSASLTLSEALATIDLPAGAEAELGGVSTQQTDAFSQLGLALLVAILIVYVVMVATFKSLRQPLLLLVSVPFAATGAILLQVASGIPIGVSSFIGLLMLVGIVVTNAIVLVDLINQYRERGMSVRDSIEHGAARRLRPILMTAVATIAALTPLGLGVTGNGGFISQPLAIIVIGGLVSSTILTLVVLPTLYYLVEGRKERFELAGITVRRSVLDVIIIPVAAVLGLLMIVNGLVLAFAPDLVARGGVTLPEDVPLPALFVPTIVIGILLIALSVWRDRAGQRKATPPTG